MVESNSPVEKSIFRSCRSHCAAVIHNFALRRVLRTAGRRRFGADARHAHGHAQTFLCDDQGERRK